MRHLTTAFVAALATLLLGGCAKKEEAPAPAAAEEAAPAPAAPAAPAEQAPTDQAAPADSNSTDAGQSGGDKVAPSPP